jgi:hypothetical protein
LIEEHGKVEKAYIDAAKSGQAVPGILKDEAMDSEDEDFGASWASRFDWQHCMPVSCLDIFERLLSRDCFRETAFERLLSFSPP